MRCITKPLLALLVLSGIDNQLAAAPKKVVFLVLDQLLAGRLGILGNPRQTSPNLDAIAREGVVFRNHHSCAPWTAASVSSIFTALYPSQHKETFFGLKDDNANVLGPYITMPELFKTAGF